MDLVPPSQAPGMDSVAANRLEKMEVKMNNMIQCINSLGKHTAQKYNDEDNDHDNDSWSSLNHTNMMDFCRSAEK